MRNELASKSSYCASGTDTNGFGATLATALLTLPLTIVLVIVQAIYTAAPDTPQKPLTQDNKFVLEA